MFSSNFNITEALILLTALNAILLTVLIIRISKKSYNTDINNKITEIKEEFYSINELLKKNSKPNKNNTQLNNHISEIKTEFLSNNALLKIIETQVDRIEDETRHQSKKITDNNHDILKALSDLREETIDAQTAKYKVNEAIRMAMGDKTKTSKPNP
tara:strand:+ start:542 stop:1012 length:471 start_codon:yes stop_codon:yes gene_type:complete